MTESTTDETVIQGNASVAVEDELPLASDADAALGDVTVDSIDASDDPVHTEQPEPSHESDEQPVFYFGPTGKRRSPVAVIALCAITFGLYGLLWHNRNTREMADFDPQMRVHAGRSTWAVAIPWIVGLLTTLAGAARLILLDMNVALPFDPHIGDRLAAAMLAGLLVVPYLTLLLPFSAVSVAMLAERIRIIEESSGVTSDAQIRPAATLALLLIPVAGPVTLIAREQRRINATWERISPTPGRRRR